ncbi:GCFC-domain-containing protein [Melanogaster broomeanus]|nr:GCFC-domain-containing protein [Melanogaster broomeanus]
MDPVIFKKSKSRPGQRARDSANDTEETSREPVEADLESPISLASKLKSKVKRSKPKSRLSFGGDEEASEGEPFQIKKSSLSRKLTLGIHPATLPATLDQATISSRSNGAPVYDQAHLSELKANTQSTRRLTGDDAYDADVSMTVDESTLSLLESPEAGESVIPSQPRILAAKERRERLRVSGTEQDYISLSVTKRIDMSQGPHPESRLVREEDELGEGDDEYAEYTSAQERIALGKKARKLEASKRKDSMQEMIADADEEDEETLEWEREQVRRGGNESATATEATPIKQVYRAAIIPPSTEIPALGPAIERLGRSLASLSSSHASNTKAATSLAEERDQLDARETELRQMIAIAESKRGWFSTFKDWIESVATFLDEKLEASENEHLSILKERAEMIAQRRNADDGDDLAIVFGSVPESSSEIDELGRVMPKANSVGLRRERRAARVTRRTQRHAGEAPSDTHTRDEGYSTDSSLPQSDALDYQSAIGRLAADAKNILSDVRAAEFRDPNRGLAKWFGEWRERYGDSYTGAWGGLGLVGAWEFWVRLEILGWNPFEVSHLDEFSWYSSLYEYSRPHSANGDCDELEFGPDGDLVSAMISTAVVPRICKMLEAGRITMIDLAEQVEASVGTDSHKFQMILKSVHSVFNDTMSNSEALLAPFVALNRPLFDPEAIAARQRLLSRASKLLDVMVQWRKYAGERSAVGQLCTQLVNNYVLPIAESGWEVGGELQVRQMIASLPRDLAGSVRAPLTA